jgi:hypothetical protein
MLSPKSQINRALGISESVQLISWGCIEFMFETRKPEDGERQRLLSIQEDHFNDLKSASNHFRFQMKYKAIYWLPTL